MSDNFNMVLQILEFLQSKGSGGKNLPQNLLTQQVETFMTNLSLKVWYLPHTTNLTTLDFYLWLYLKDTLYHSKPAKLEELLEEITVSCAAIPEHKLTLMSVKFSTAQMLTGNIVNTSHNSTCHNTFYIHPSVDLQ